MSYLHRPFWFISCKNLLHILVVCDNLSISVIICIVSLKVAMSSVVLFLGVCVLLKSDFHFVFVIFGFGMQFFYLRLVVIQRCCHGGQCSLYFC